MLAFRRSILVCLALAVAAVDARGQAPQDTVLPDSVIPIEELRVEIGRLRVGGIPLMRTPMAAQVLQTAELRRSARLTVADAMAELPGVSLSDQFGSPFQPDVRLRGFSVSPVVGLPQSLSVFVDGVRVNEPDASQVHFNLIPMDEVERVDVIRGPTGPFGRNTLAGALNILTARGSGPPSGQLELRGGYFGEYEGRGRAQGTFGPFDYYAAGGYYRTDGWRDKNAAEQIQAFGKFGWRGEDTDVWISYTFADDSIEGPGSLPRSWLNGGPLPADIANPPDDRRKLQYTGGLGDYFLPLMHFVNANLEHRLADRWSLQGNAYGRFIEFEQFNDNITECNALGLTDIGSGGATVQLSHRRDPDLIGTFGVEYVRNDVDIEILEMPNQQVAECAGIPASGNQTERVGTVEDNIGAYSELWWSIDPMWSLHGSLRYDHVNLPFTDFLDPSGSGTNKFDQVSGSLGADLVFTNGLGVFGSYGRGFRAPVILEITCADPEDPCPLPFELGADPPLDAVTTDTWQVGVRYTSGAGVQGQVVGYWSEVYDDLFNVIDPENPTRGFFTNIDRTRRQGAELSLAVRPVPELSLRGSFGWNRATFQSPATLAVPFFEGDEEEEEEPGGEEEEVEVPQVQPGDRFPMVPDVTFTIGGTYTPSHWTLDLTGRFVGPQYMIGDEANLEPFGRMDTYFILDGYIERRIGPTSVYVRAQNLLDTRHETFGIVASKVRLSPGEEDELVEPFFTPGQPFRLFAGLRWNLE